MGNSTLERIERFGLKAPNGTNYAISLLRPLGAFEPGVAKIFFVTDADMIFGTAAEVYGAQQVMNGAHPAVIVGIGYGVSPMEMSQLRTVDLTPPMDAASSDAVDPLSALVGSGRGGADAFLDFILGELTQAVVARAPEAAATGNMLFGHSLGGLFTTHALFTRPEAFAGFFISSPSLWWNDFAIMREADAFRAALARLDAKPQVVVGVGGEEQVVPQSIPKWLAAAMPLEAVQELVRKSRMVDAARELGTLIEDAGITRSFVRVYEGEDHSSVIPAVLTRSILFAFKAF